MTGLNLLVNLGGPLPDEIAYLSTLTSLTLKTASLAGTLPSSWSVMTNLVSIDLQVRQSHGCDTGERVGEEVRQSQG